ncbi:hypothetical protein RUM44_002835 [Polyplax serrata]|uniref:Acetyl-coenzyme A transporter 1 n=1 Tax=Polyplax serrata TaxID=468196 RepID=A0ABR1AFW3_POLSC
MSPKKRNGSARLTIENDVFHQRKYNKNSFEFEKLKGDRGNIAILFFLYLLQGIPLGLVQAIPIILTNSGVSYTQQAKFSLVNWPFSLKLLWAPVLDCIYWGKLGRRKSWLVPTQYLIGILMIFLSHCVDDLLGNGGSEPNIQLLVLSFFFLNFLAATQDIAVDGWALTMLKRQNVSYASTCNSVGQTAGYFLGYVTFLALESPSFCNTYLRDKPLDHGIVTLSAVLLTAKIGFSACDVVTGLKLVEAGIPKEKMALLAVPLVPLQVALPFFLSRYLTGQNPMNVFLTAYPYRLGCGILFSIFVAVTPYFVVNHELPVIYCIIFLVIYCFHQVTSNSMFVAQMAFFAKVSDPAIGGTYMTLLNTLANIGGTWPQALALWFVELLTFKKCSNEKGIKCSSAAEMELCSKEGGTCVTSIDGYYIETVLCTLIGCLWLLWGRRSVKRLEMYGMDSFSVKRLGAERRKR